MSKLTRADVLLSDRTMTYDDIRNYTGTATKLHCTGRTLSNTNGEGWFYLQPAGVANMPDDDGVTLVGTSGKLWRRKYNGRRNVMWYGAMQGDDSQLAADANREAFRKACASYRSLWEAQVSANENIAVLAPAGDYNLSNGFTVPEGVSLIGDGLGSTRLKIETATAATQGYKLPLISLGKIINADSSTDNTDGVFLPGLAPEIHNLYLNPKNSNTAVEVATDTAGKDLAGFRIGVLWVQAAVAIKMRNISDGIIDQVMFEAATAVGIQTEGSVQNVMINGYYGFDVGFPMLFGGTLNNFNIGTLQANYSRNCVIAVESSSIVRGLKIGDMVCNQNAQYDSFTSVVDVGGTSNMELTVGQMSVRNANGFAITNNGVGSVFNIGTLELNQTPLNPVYTQGNSLKGIKTNGGIFNIGQVFTNGLTTPLVETNGANSPIVNIGGGTVGGGSLSSIIQANDTGDSTYIHMGAKNESGKPIVNQSGANKVSYESSLPILQNSLYKYAELPYSEGGSAWEVTVRATPLPNNPYKLLEKYIIHVDTVYNGTSVVTVITKTKVSGWAGGQIPDVMQVTVDKSTTSGAGTCYVQVPVTYGGVLISAKTLHI